MNARSLLLLVSLLLLLLSSSLTQAADPNGPGDVLINEFVANSADSEWVELYNTTNAPLDISGHYIDDITGGGGSPKTIPSGTIISAHGYYVTYFKKGVFTRAPIGFNPGNFPEVQLIVKHAFLPGYQLRQLTHSLEVVREKISELTFVGRYAKTPNILQAYQVKAAIQATSPQFLVRILQVDPSSG
ncbi:MAG TPA: lamin tail domain-containing protein [candidate division Zixibacteria bacterium]|nr:lamin tail domain-containing protein [candidate division Zixibacteria bacterium]